MNVAFLFDSSHPFLGVIPGYTALRRILETQVLQESGRHVRVSIGEVLTLRATQASGGTTTDDLNAFCRQVYVPKSLNLLLGDKLEGTYRHSEVFCALFQNLTTSIAQALHDALNDGGPYLGAMDVDFSLPIHLLLFRNSLVESLRLRGHECSVFYMTINDDPDLSLQSLLEETGYEVAYEDMGLRRTVFDDYDSLEHFQRIADFETAFVGLGDLDADAVSDLTTSLEELHPRLFNGFAAAARALGRAET